MTTIKHISSSNTNNNTNENNNTMKKLLFSTIANFAPA